MAVLDLQPSMLFSDSSYRNNSECNVSFLVYYTSVALLQCEQTLPPSLESWRGVIPAGECNAYWHDRELLLKTISLQEKRNESDFFPFFLLSHCFKINFWSDLQKLRCQKHMYYRFHLCRVGKLLSVHFHLGEPCNFPDIKSPKVLITAEFDPSHFLGKNPTLFFAKAISFSIWICASNISSL